MNGVSRQHVDCCRHDFGDVLQVNEIGAAHRFPHPVSYSIGSNREADVIQGLVNLGRGMMRTVFIADHCDRGNASVGDHSSCIVGFFQERVHALQSKFCHAARLTKPYRCAEDENVDSEYLLTDNRPIVPVTFI